MNYNVRIVDTIISIMGWENEKFFGSTVGIARCIGIENNDRILLSVKHLFLHHPTRMHLLRRSI